MITGAVPGAPRPTALVALTEEAVSALCAQLIRGRPPTRQSAVGAADLSY